MVFKLYKRNFLVLDDKRLNKQVLECSQIYSVLIGESIGYKNHPAVLMWKNKEKEFIYYWKLVSIEYAKRNKKEHKASCFFKFEPVEVTFDKKVYISHKYNLLLKDFDHYIKFFKVYDLSIFEKLKARGGGYFWPICYGKKAISDSLFWENILKDQ